MTKALFRLCYEYVVGKRAWGVIDGCNLVEVHISLAYSVL